MSYSEVHRLPIRYRRWFLRRLVRHFEEKAEAHEKARTESKNNSKSENMSNLDKFQSQIDKKFSQ